MLLNPAERLMQLNPNFQRNVQKAVIRSEALRAEKELLISFPPGYDEQQQYPVLLLHDGDDYFYMGRIVTQANALIHQGELQPFLIVGLPVNHKQRNQEYSPLGDRHQQHLHFIAEELFPFVQRNIPAADLSPDNTVVGGSSLGGTISLHFALTYPNLCRRLFLQSCAFFQPTFAQIKKAPTLEQMTIYQLIGQDETSVPTAMGALNFLQQNRTAHRLFTEKQATVHYVEAEGDHTWRLWQKDLPYALRYFFIFQ